MTTLNIFQKSTITVCMGGTVTREYPIQPMFASGDLRNIYTKEAFSDRVIEQYNRYTADINRATYHADREHLLDMRHQYFVQAMRNQAVQQCNKDF